MLVLSRQVDQTIMISDDIEVTVVDIRGDKVRLGINAPRPISIHRKEVYDQIKKDFKERHATVIIENERDLQAVGTGYRLKVIQEIAKRGDIPCSERLAAIQWVSSLGQEGDPGFYVREACSNIQKAEAQCNSSTSKVED